MKDYRIWVEVAERKRKCHRCGGEVAKGVMFVRMGDRSRPRRAHSICATCFETVMNDLSHDFQLMKDAPAAPALEPALEPAEGAVLAADLIGPRCFACGQPPERCRCGQEAYR